MNGLIKFLINLYFNLEKIKFLMLGDEILFGN